MISQLVDAACREAASATAISWTGDSWTYSQLSAEADRLASQHPQVRGGRVGISCRAVPRQLALLVALDRLSASAFLLPAQPSREVLLSLASQYGVAAVINDDAVETLSSDAGHVHAVSTADSPGTVVLFTSGTSGPPKPALHTWNSLSAAVSRHPRNVGRRWLLAYDISRFAGLQVMLQSLATSGQLCVPASREPLDVVACLQRDRVEFASGTPTFWRMLLAAVDRSELAASSLEQITLGGEAVDQDVLDNLKRAFPRARISHIYASTEMGACFVVNDGRAGFPAEYLDDPTLPAQLRIADDGELLIASKRAMKQYLGERVATQEWFPTGDLVRLDGDRVYFVGRKSECINVGGAKVFPADVERVIRTVPGVREVRVHRVASSVVGELVGAEIEPASGTAPAVLRESVLTACRRELAKYQVPAILRFVERVSINDTGKLNRGEG